MNKEEILGAYAALRGELGKPPRMKEFLESTRVSRYQIAKNFRSWGEMVIAAGDKPGELMIPSYCDRDYIDAYGGFIRKHKRLPSVADWLYNGIKPSWGTYRMRFKCNWGEMPLMFYDLIREREEWKDVAKMMTEQYMISTEQKTGVESAPPPYVSDRDHRLDVRLMNVLPRTILNLVALSRCTGSAIEFEAQCSEVFKMLGYEVTQLGQGTGRRADGIAEDPLNKYAVIFDAKQRREKYTPGTDDRAIMDYIRDERRRLLERGYDKIYFLVISSAFGRINPAWIHKVQAETGAAVSFITAETLLRLLAEKIKYPRRVDTGRMQGLFVKGGEVGLKEVRRIVN